MFKWLREFLEIRHEFRERRLRLLQESNEKRCESCEILKIELQRINIEKEKLLNRLFDKPIDLPVGNPVDITPPKQIPWQVRRQMLEAEDREKARLMRESAKPNRIMTNEESRTQKVEDIEKELGIENGERDIS